MAHDRGRIPLWNPYLRIRLAVPCDLLCLLSLRDTAFAVVDVNREVTLVTPAEQTAPVGDDPFFTDDESFVQLDWSGVDGTRHGEAELLDLDSGFLIPQQMDPEVNLTPLLEERGG